MPQDKDDEKQHTWASSQKLQRRLLNPSAAAKAPGRPKKTTSVKLTPGISPGAKKMIAARDKRDKAVASARSTAKKPIEKLKSAVTGKPQSAAKKTPKMSNDY